MYVYMPEKEKKSDPKKEQNKFWLTRPKGSHLTTKKKSGNPGGINLKRDRKRPYPGVKTNSTNEKLKKKDVRFGDDKEDTFTPLNSDEKFDVHGRTIDCIEGHKSELAEANDSSEFGYEGQYQPPYLPPSPDCGPEIEAGLNALKQCKEGEETWGGMVGRMGRKGRNGIKGRKGRTRKNKTKKSRGKSKRNAKRHAKSHKKNRNI